MNLNRKWYIILVALVSLSACHKPYYIQQHSDHLYTIDKKTTSADTSLQHMLQPYKKNMDAQMGVIIGHADTTISLEQPESAMGNFIADAQLAAARKLDPSVVAAVTNQGGIRISYISAGGIALGKMYELMPFDNTLTLIDIPGDTLRTFCSHMAALKGWPVSGLQYTIKDSSIAENILVNGQPLESNKMYKFAVSDYVAHGGDDCKFLVALKQQPTTIFIRDILIDYVKQQEQEHKPLHATIQNRVSYAQ